MEKNSPHLIQHDSSGKALQLLDQRHLALNEYWLQETISQHPGILPTASIDQKYAPLVSIGREIATESGPIDNLFISPQGFLVMVETKLWRNPQARREVLAQVWDYGAALARWDFDKLDQKVTEYIRKYHQQEMDLPTWVENRLGPFENGRDYFEEQVSKNLRLGKLLSLIVGDHIQDSLVRMLEYTLNKYPHLAIDLALVELTCYRWEGSDTWPLLVIPNLVARTEIYQRSIVEITLTNGGKYTVEAKQEAIEPKAKGRRQVLSDEDAYWDLLKKNAPESVSSAQQLITLFRDLDGVLVETSTSSLVVRLLVQDSGEKATLFFIDKNGLVEVWPETTRSQIERGGVKGVFIDQYLTSLEDILVKKDWRCVKPVVKVDDKALFTAVKLLIEAVQSTEME